MRRACISTIALLAASLAPIASQSTANAQSAGKDLPDRIELGRDARGEPCAAARNWSDAALPGYFSESYTITCRGATAGRSLGIEIGRAHV